MALTHAHSLARRPPLPVGWLHSACACSGLDFRPVISVLTAQCGCWPVLREISRAIAFGMRMVDLSPGSDVGLGKEGKIKNGIVLSVDPHMATLSHSRQTCQICRGTLFPFPRLGDLLGRPPGHHHSATIPRIAYAPCERGSAAPHCLLVGPSHLSKTMAVFLAPCGDGEVCDTVVSPFPISPFPRLRCKICHVCIRPAIQRPLLSVTEPTSHTTR